MEQHEVSEELERLHEDEIVESLLLKRGFDVANRHVIGALALRSINHIRDCHRLINYIVKMVDSGGVKCRGGCNPPCLDHLRLHEARLALEWKEVPGGLK